MTNVSVAHIEYLIEEYKKRIERHSIEAYYNETFSAGCQDAYEQVVEDLVILLKGATVTQDKSNV